MAENNRGETPPITIKKYANRRLYNTATSSYVTLDHLSQMVKDGVDFVVFDAKTGEDITRSVLTQIIVEEESKGQNLLPTSFLRHLISFYGDSLQGLVPRYLEYSMHSFTRNQEQIRRYMQDTLDGLFPFNQFEEMGKQNMALFENAMKMLTPFSPPGAPRNGEDRGEQQAAPQKKQPAGTDEETLGELKSKLAEMQKQIDSLSGSKGGGKGQG